MERGLIKILLVEDDEDDYTLVRSLLSEFRSSNFSLEWVATYDDALQEMKRNHYDVYIVDYRLGQHNGLDLLKDADVIRKGVPTILLTGQGDYDLDVKAMRAGVADYLEKTQIAAPLLERSIRYSLERAKASADLRELSSKLLDAQEEERKRVAKDLHDSIGSKLTAVKLRLEEKLEQMGNHPPPDKVSLEQITAMIRDLVQETRRICKNLRPAILDDLGIVPTIRSVSREFAGLHPNIQIEQNIDVNEDQVPELLKIVIYRILQEALNNAVKYSEADFVHVTLQRAKENLKLQIEDNGKGFDLREVLNGDNTIAGIGLSSMRERTEISGGAFSLMSSKGKGTIVRAVWSLPELNSNKA